MSALETCVANCLPFLLVSYRFCWLLVRSTICLNSWISYMIWLLVDHQGFGMVMAFGRLWVCLCHRCSNLFFFCCRGRISCCLNIPFDWNRWGLSATASSIETCSFTVLFYLNLISSALNFFLLKRPMDFASECQNSFWPFSHIHFVPSWVPGQGRTHSQGLSVKLVFHRGHQYAQVSPSIYSRRAPTIHIHSNPRSKECLVGSKLQPGRPLISENREYLAYLHSLLYAEYKIRQRYLFPRQRAAGQQTAQPRMSQRGPTSSSRRRAPPGGLELVNPWMVGLFPIGLMCSRPLRRLLLSWSKRQCAFVRTQLDWLYQESYSRTLAHFHQRKSQDRAGHFGFCRRWIICLCRRWMRNARTHSRFVGCWVYNNSRSSPALGWIWLPCFPIQCLRLHTDHSHYCPSYRRLHFCKEARCGRHRIWLSLDAFQAGLRPERERTSGPCMDHWFRVGRKRWSPSSRPNWWLLWKPSGSTHKQPE